MRAADGPQTEALTELFDRNARAAKAWAPKRKTDDAADSSSSDDEGEAAPADEAKKAPFVKGAGIRKIRMGTFQDTGKCKGCVAGLTTALTIYRWAFIDFLSPDQATASLLNARNHSLHGRELTVEYASLDAVRRGCVRAFARSR